MTIHCDAQRSYNTPHAPHMQGVNPDFFTANAHCMQPGAAVHQGACVRRVVAGIAGWCGGRGTEGSSPSSVACTMQKATRLSPFPSWCSTRSIRQVSYSERVLAKWLEKGKSGER